jgi:hypothetical protein
MTLVLFLVLRNSKFPWTTTCSCFCSWTQFSGRVRIIGGSPYFSRKSLIIWSCLSTRRLGVHVRFPEGAISFGWLLPCGVCLRRATLWRALPVSLNFLRIRPWRAASTSVFLGNSPPALLLPRGFWRISLVY